MSIKPAIPKGTRDLLPWEMVQRDYIIQQIKSVFNKYGFLPIETPAMENLSTLTGKYGEEGDRLIFKILNSGDYLKKVPAELLQKENAAELSSHITEKALRYDLTVPFARYVVQNQNELVFPFKRYQIQPVWRADRPQKGRYREFWQCDADVVGSDSLLLDLDFVEIYAEVFSRLQLPVSIKINNRKILAGLAEILHISDRLNEFTIALDKLDKIGAEGVVRELEKRQFAEATIKGLQELIELNNQVEPLGALRHMLEGSALGQQGCDELDFIRQHCPDLGAYASLDMDFTLARGLDYYTGSIFEVVARDIQLGSIGGGGRYDDLTGIFGMKDLSGIGISFGLERIYLALKERNLLPNESYGATEVLLVNFGPKEGLYATQMARDLRGLNVRTQVYPHPAKLKKQLDFADKNNIKTVIIAGESEIEEGKLTLKNMDSGEQEKLSRIELLEKFNPSQQNNYGYH